MILACCLNGLSHFHLIYFVLHEVEYVELFNRFLMALICSVIQFIDPFWRLTDHMFTFYRPF